MTDHPSQGGRVLTSRPPQGAEVPPPTLTKIQNHEEFQKEGSPDEKESGQEEECPSSSGPPDRNPGSCA